MKIYAKMKYPCGLEAEMSIETMFARINLSEDSRLDATKCPLHGKKCIKERREK